MSGIQSFVTEYSTNLKYLLKSADDQSLKVELQRDTQVQVLIQCIEMSHEGSCCSTACISHKHGCLHLHEALSVQVTPDSGDNLASLYKGILNIRIHDEIHISLTVTKVRIGHSVELLRKRLQVLTEQHCLNRMNRYLSLLCTEHISLNTDDVTYVILLEVCIGFLTERIS